MVSAAHRLALLGALVLGAAVASCSDDDEAAEPTPATTAESDETGAGEDDPSSTTTESDDDPSSTTTSTTEAVAEFEPTFAEGDCPFEAPPEAPLRCGTVAVPLDLADPEGETVDVAVAVVGDDTVGPPLMLLAGGPGQHSIELQVPPLLAPEAAVVLEKRALVFFDPRGVGFSEPQLDCPEFTEVTTLEGSALLDAAAACHDRLVDEGNDLSAYDTAANVADVGFVRTALGYDEVDLYGVSYGAYLALQVARDADWLRTLTLDSPIPAEAVFIEDAGSSFQRALDALFVRCDADEMCATTYPDLEGTLATLVTSLEATPLAVEIPGAEGEPPTPVMVDADVFANVLFSLFYGGPTTIGAIPAVITSLAAGDASLLVEAGGQATMSLVISQGENFSVNCAEGATQIADGDLEAAAEDLSPLVRGHFLPTSLIGGPMLLEACSDWDVEPADESLFEPVESDVASFVVTGQLDQITPPEYGETVVEGLPNAILVEIAGTGHAPIFSSGECGAGLLFDFLDDPDAELDTSCASSVPLEFVPLGG